MRTFLVSAVAATTVLTTVAIGMATDANAASRRTQHRASAPPIVRQDPYGGYNMLAPGVSPYQGRRDVNPISGTPRWNAAGGAA